MMIFRNPFKTPTYDRLKKESNFYQVYCGKTASLQTAELSTTEASCYKHCVSLHMYRSLISLKHASQIQLKKLGAIARSVAMSLGNQEAPRSILASGLSFCEDLVKKLFLRPFFLSFKGFLMFH